jgi:adenylosuccinate synthase
MPVTVVIGAQWGDEGKGKLVDLMAAGADIVARYQGGANAGHTIEWGGTGGAPAQRAVLHLVPSGVFHEGTACVIGGGVVLDPVALLDEIAMVERMGFSVEGRLFVSHTAHVIMPYHKRLDAAREGTAGAIGTTGRGIGPAYVDKYARSGIRVVDLLDRDALARKIRAAVEEKNTVLRAVYGADTLDVEAIVEEYVALDRRIDPYVKDTAHFLQEALAKGKRVIAEGAQGALLDVDFGTYPFVTSSSPTVGGACTGLGIPPTRIDRVVGIAKAYATRVGHGPFVTELEDETGERLRRVGHEFGATTGRPRRCGWLDLVALRYSARLNGFTELAITKLDVLAGLDEVKVCTRYRVDGHETDRFPADVPSLERAEPLYESFEGWADPGTDATHFEALPAAAQRYLRFVERETGVPIGSVSTGPRREETIVMRDGE